MNAAKRPRGPAVSAGRRRTRRTGLIVVALLVGSVALALLVAQKYHLGVPGTAVTVLLGGGAPALLYLAWAAYKDQQRDVSGSEGLTLPGVADQLARAVGAQWAAEAKMRRLNDPYPLPVSWSAADPFLCDGWDVLTTLATSGVGGTSPSPPSTWADSPDGLAGSGGDLVGVLARVPTGRLAVLGEPGSGKTMLMLRLALDLLKDRTSGSPVPVLASLASWNPEAQDLRDWLAAQLTIDHRSLAEAAPQGTAEGTRIAALLAEGLILPILDGLDEIPDAVRGPAIRRINDALRHGERLVVSCRTGQYRDAVRPPGGVEVTLRAAAAVQLCPLNADDVSRYLSADAGGPVGAARWDPVLATLGTSAPAGQALVTPLMVSLARAIYNPRPGESSGRLRDPAELCSPAMPDRQAVEQHLFDRFIASAYGSGTVSRWTAQQAERTLVFLARHLDHAIDSADIAWWQLSQALPPATFALATGLGVALATGLGVWLAGAGALGLGIETGFVRELITGLVAGLGVGLATGLGVWLMADLVRKPSRGMRIGVVEMGEGLATGLGGGLAIGFLGGFVFGLVRGLRTANLFGPGLELFAGGLGRGLVIGLKAGLVAGLMLMFMGGLQVGADDLATAATPRPRAVLARDRQAALLLMLVSGLGTGLVFGLAGGFLGGLKAGLGAGLVGGLVFGPVVGLLASGAQTAWPSYILTIGWLAFHHRLPWSLMGFLEDAHKRGILRQAGGVYQFRHIELQHRLATAPDPVPPSQS